MHNLKYITDVLVDNRQQVIDLAKQFWPKKNEKLYLGEIDVSQLNIDDKYGTKINLNKYVDNGLYRFDIETIEANKGDAPEVEIPAKTCYLLKQYLKSGNFKDPVCTHYNPRLDSNVVHPGGTRQLILDLFHTGPVSTFYFNTSGVQPKFIKYLKEIPVEQLDREYYIAIVADHGSLIPHILKLGGVQKLPQGIIDAHNNIKRNLTNKRYKIYSNQPLDILKKFYTTKQRRSSVSITFKTRKTTKDELKASYLVLSGMDYEDKRLKVVHRTS